MKAMVAETAGKPMDLRDVATREPGEGEIRISVKASGVCYTDLRIVEAMGGAFMPLIPGHETAGVVSALGPGVAGWAIGDRVGVHALFTCGTCVYCAAGEEEACIQGIATLSGLGRDGGYAEEMILPADHAVSLPEGLSFADAAPFLCAGLTSYAGLKNGGIEPGQRVGIIGIGGLGHLAIPIAKALGTEVYAVTSTPDKAGFAKSLGATHAGSPAEMAAALKEAGGAHVVLSTANALDPLSEIAPAMAKQGTIVLAAGGETLPFPLGLFLGLQLRLMGSFYGSKRDVEAVLALAAEHNIRPIIERYPLAAANEVHQRLRDNAVRYRAVLEP
jgi:D-arabinose 1-dehydrogenase-like Zn-dependent alcohol dehydrogenase